MLPAPWTMCLMLVEQSLCLNMCLFIMTDCSSVRLTLQALFCYTVAHSSNQQPAIQNDHRESMRPEEQPP